MRAVLSAVLTALLAMSATVVLAQSAAGVTDRRRIPFRQEPASLEEQGWQIGVTLLLLLAAAVAALYLVRNRVPGALRRQGQRERIQIADRVRLDARTRVYVLRFRDHEYLLAQSGDSIVQLRPTSQRRADSEDHDD